MRDMRIGDKCVIGGRCGTTGSVERAQSGLLPLGVATSFCLAFKTGQIGHGVGGTQTEERVANSLYAGSEGVSSYSVD